MERDKIPQRRLALIIRITALIVIAAAMLLHAYTGFFKGSREFISVNLGRIVWSWLPYLVCLLIAVGRRNPVIPLCGAFLPLIMDLILYDSVFIHPTSSTAAIGLLFMPLYNLALFMPLGLLIGFFLAVLLKKEKYL